MTISNTLSSAAKCLQKFLIRGLPLCSYVFVNNTTIVIHTMAGQEGRKDLYCALSLFLEILSDDLFYDFACGLISFFHDVFHSYSHKCSDAFKSSRLQGFDGVNTSVAEQFNSFVKCIKGSASQFSQVRFAFHLQFVISEWNSRKSDRVRKIAITYLKK